MTPNPKKVKKAKGAGNERLAAVVGEVQAATRACATELLRLCEALRGVFAADATAEWAPLAGNASDDAADSSEAVRRYWFDVTQCAAPLPVGIRPYHQQPGHGPEAPGNRARF